MRRLGVHTSIAGGLHLGLLRAHALGCNTLQIFTHNPRAWATAPLSEREKDHFTALRRELGLDPVFSHASYLINIASTDEGLRRKSQGLLATEMELADELGIDYVVLHVGGARDDEGRRRASSSIRSALKGRTGGAGLLLENTAGRRGDAGSDIQSLAAIMEGSGGLVSGICLDSCHAFAAGYDLRSSRGLRSLSDDIESRVGLGMLKLIHLNDSKGEAGSRRDRHEHIGRGKIGARALERFIRHKPFARTPIILETPKKSESDDAANLAAVRKMLSPRKSRA
ncbi:MAG: deoxyribonuclease IV [Nitrospirota bacterium]|jgi:deoxyribonuclease-4